MMRVPLGSTVIYDIVEIFISKHKVKNFNVTTNEDQSDKDKYRGLKEYV
jgi:hypothetical protein